jgi:hypothetical protein
MRSFQLTSNYVFPRDGVWAIRFPAETLQATFLL